MQAYQVHTSNGGVRDCGAFFLDMVGEFHRQHLQIDWSLSKRRHTHEEIEKLIDQAWASHSEKVHRTSGRLFNGSLCRLIDCNVDGQKLTLAMGPVSFKEHLGTNMTNAQLRYLHGVDVLADAIGVSSAITTRDGFLVLGRRNNNALFNPDKIHPIGGMISPPKKLTQTPDPFLAMEEEIQEELNITPDRIRHMVCLGLVREKKIVQPELIFDVSVDIGIEEVLRGAVYARDFDEHSELIPIRDSQPSMVRFLDQHHQELTPVCMATLLLHGQRHWGAGWFAATRGYIGGVV